MLKKIYSKNIHFKCQGSANCCVSRGSYGFVYLSLIDLKKISKFFKLDKIKFIRKYCEYTNGFLHLRETKKNGDCIVNGVGKNVYNACGKYSINQSAFLISKSDYVISHDTGMMHIASAFKKKIYAIFGSTTPDFGMSPYMSDPESEIIEVKGLNCRPCSKIGFEKEEQ